MYRIVIALAVSLACSGCSSMRGVMVMDVDNGPKPVFKTTKCTVPNADGVRCNVKTCKADEASNCAVFADRCVESGNDYEGNSQSGTCKRTSGTPT
jgi:hypothetical protein